MRNPKKGRKGISQSSVPGWEAACARVISAVMVSSSLQQVDVVHLDVSRFAVRATTKARPTATSAAAKPITRRAKAWPETEPLWRAKAMKLKVGRVEHELDAHEDHQGVAPDQHTGDADGETEGGDEGGPC